MLFNKGKQYLCLPLLNSWSTKNQLLFATGIEQIAVIAVVKMGFHSTTPTCDCVVCELLVMSGIFFSWYYNGTLWELYKARYPFLIGMWAMQTLLMWQLTVLLLCLQLLLSPVYLTRSLGFEAFQCALCSLPQLRITLILPFNLFYQDIYEIIRLLSIVLSWYFPQLPVSEGLSNL